MSGKENVQIVATAKDHASPTLKKLQANVTSLGSKGRGPIGGLLSGLGGISPAAMVGAVGIGVMTAALADGVAGALEEEKQLARLDQALATNVKGWDGNREAIDRATDAAMDLAFSDDEARESMIKLVTATGNVNQSLSQTRLAMDIARGRNIDLATATDIVIKANMGNVGALRRMGIELDKDATKTEILTTLQERYAGQAAAYADTTAGRFEAAQRKVDNAMEDVGHTAISTAAALMGVGDAMNGDTEASADLLHALGGIIPGLDALADEVDAWRERTGKSVGRLPKDVEGILRAGAPGVHDALANLFRIQSNRIAQADAFADAFTDDLAGSLRSNKDTVKDAMKDLMWAVNHPGKLEKEGKRLADALESEDLARALESENPMIRAQAEQTRATLEAQWLLLTSEAYQTGVNAADALERGLGTFNPPNFNFRDAWVNSVRPGEVGARAAGGPVNPGGTYLVGERGPEVLQMGSNQRGYVSPGLGDQATHHIVVNVDGRKLFEIVDERMGRRLSRTPAGIVNRG